MTELNDILKKYSTLLDAMKQLEAEVPVIENIYQELQAIIQKQTRTEENALERINDSAKTATEIAEKIDSTAKELKKQQKAFETTVKAAKKQQDDFIRIADERIALLQQLTQQQPAQDSSDELSRRLSSLEKKLAALEAQKAESPARSNKATVKKEPTKSAYLIGKNSFPSNAKHFTFANIERVSEKKPYGIVIEDKIIKVPYWTSMLDTVVPYVFEKYNISAESLYQREYSTTSSAQRPIPYFVKGSSSDNTYRYISKLGMSVHFAGAEEAVEALNILLCDYLQIDRAAVALFYHDK